MTVGDLPPLQTGIITLPNLTLGVSDTVPTPRLLTDKMIIVATCAVALNPTDFKMPAAFPSPGAVDGADFAGDIVQVGPAVTKWRVGDRVFGAVQGADPKNHQSGAFQQFVPAYEREVLRVPDGMSYETAAAIGGACIGTAALALYCSLGLGPLPGGEACLKPLPVLVYGGSTATGAMTIQLLKCSGHIPITTCSPHNFELARSYGAAAVFDYRSPTCAADIRAFAKNNLRHVLDCITQPSSIKLCYDSIGRMGGKYTAVEQQPDLGTRRKTVKQDWVMGMTITGRPVELGKGYEFPVVPEHVEFGDVWGPICQKLIDEGQIRAHPIRLGSGGFEGILEGLDLLRSKAVSGEKLVYRIC